MTTHQRIVILGGAGSGKTTLARRLAHAHSLAYLSLDDVAWGANPVRLPLETSIEKIREFVDRESNWVVEGCYADLVEPLLDSATEMLFLNPGVETCLKHCRQRPWESDKFPSKSEQDSMLETLLEFVRLYDERQDEYGLHRHRQVFEHYSGPKTEFRSTADYPGPAPSADGDDT